MLNKKDMASNLIQALTSNLDGAGVSNRPEVAQLTLGSESLHAENLETAKATKDTLDSTVEATISEAELGVEGFQFTAAQMNAAKSIAALAMDPQLAREYQSKLRAPVDGQGATVISADSLGVEDIIDPVELGTEAFDGQAMNNALYFSVAYNLMAARQDKFGETFFPTISIDPTVSGATIETEFISLFQDITRDVSGGAVAQKFDKKPIIKSMYDNDIFGTDKNKVIPVLRTENETIFLKDHARVEVNGSEEITTAPIKFGKEFSLLSVSQTDAQLAKGIMDNTDALDRRIMLDKIYFSVSGDVDSVATTDLLSFDTSVLPLSNFTYTTQDHNKDLALAFSSRSITINTTDSLTVEGTTSTVLGQLPANHTVTLNVVINGSSNAQSSDTRVYGSVIEVVAVTDAAGTKLPSNNADYIAIVAALETLKLEGYDLEAHRTNSNLRTRGQLVTSDSYVQMYAVPLRSGITVITSINNASGNDNDAAKISTQVTLAGIRTSAEAVKTLVTYAESLRNITVSGNASDVVLDGIGRHHVNTYYAESTIDVAADIDSIRSTERIDDMQSVLVNHIKNEVITMAIESNYQIATNVLGTGSGKIKVLIGTDPKIAHYLSLGKNKLDLGEDFEAVVVSTPNKLMKGKIIYSFGTGGADLNTKPNPLNFGQCFWSPTITTDVVRTTNNATARELQTMPRFLHVVNLPIVNVTYVQGIETALKKITINMHTA